MRRPRFSFVPSFGVALPASEARRLFADGLGFEELEGSSEDLAFLLGKATLFVDPRADDDAPPGFLPLFVTDDLEAARAHLAGLGFVVEGMPWAPDAPGFMVRVGEAAFCVAHTDRVLEERAAALDDEEE